jgi:hypothetical protein
MAISENTRVAKAGRAMGKAIIEMVHLMYLNDNALEFLKAIVKTLTIEFNRRKRGD